MAEGYANIPLKEQTIFKTRAERARTFLGCIDGILVFKAVSLVSEVGVCPISVAVWVYDPQFGKI